MEFRARACLQHLMKCRRVPGDVIEFGVCEGFTCGPLARWLNRAAPAKKYYALDWWQGLPADAIGQFDGELRPGECPWDFDTFRRGPGALPNVVTVRGRVEVTLPRLEVPAISFAWVDLDLYEPTRVAWQWLRPRLSPGAVVGFHDYGYARTPGITKFVDEEVRGPGLVELEDTYACLFFRVL